MASEIEHRVSSTDLVSTIAARTRRIGGNDGGWPGLTLYRFAAPAAPSWEEIQSLSLGIVAQGRKAVLVDGERYVYDPFHYLVLGSNLQFQAEILQASAEEPFLSFVLQIDPALVRKVAAEMGALPVGGLSPPASDDRAEPGVVSPLDPELLSAVLRFCARSTATPIVVCSRRCASRRWCTGCCGVSSSPGCCGSPPGRARARRSPSSQLRSGALCRAVDRR